MNTTNTLLLLFLYYITLISTVTVNSHYVDPRIATLTILQTDSGSASVKLVSNSNTNSADTETTTCTFTYRTSNDIVLATSINKAADGGGELGSIIITVDSINKVLSGQCISTQFDYWHYEICFGQSIKQYHADDKYILGRTIADKPISDTSIEYINGDLCDINSNTKIKRRTIVQYACRETATNPIIVSITEPSMCEYLLIIATALVCNDNRYNKLTAASEGLIAGEIIDNITEDWFLQIVQYTDTTNTNNNDNTDNDNRIYCSINSLENRALGSKLNFIDFTLKLSTSNSNINSNNNSPIKYTATHPGRIPIDSSELVIKSNYIQNSPDFNGKLSLVKIYKN